MGQQGTTPRVLLAGDSTVAACPAHETPMSGWGPHLGSPLNARWGAALARAGRPVTSLAVLNAARGGATTESHRGDGLWAALLGESRPGDVVVLQFGHNDRKRTHLAAHGAYRDNLERFCDETLDRGCLPVLVTPVAVRNFVDGVLVDTHGEFPAAVLDLARARGLPSIDLTRLSGDLLAALGHEASAAHLSHYPAGHPLYPNGCADDVHHSFIGAVAVAELVAAELVDIIEKRLPPADRILGAPPHEPIDALASGPR